MAIYDGTRNYDHHCGIRYEVATLEATGFQWAAVGQKEKEANPKNYGKSQPKFNGGIISPIETRLQKNDKIYRFSDSASNQEQIVGGRWWFDMDTCIFLWSKAGIGQTDAGYRSAARAAFAVLHEWGDMGRLVTGILACDFWAFKGLTAPAKGNECSINNPYGLDGLQIFVPGGFVKSDFTAVKDAALTRVKY